jgi:hypothetical protein
MTTQNRINSKFYQIANVDAVGDVKDINVPGNITFGGNITSTNPDASLVANTVTANNLTSIVTNLGDISNITILGGTSSQFLQTDGNGNLTFASVTTSAAGNTGEIQFNDSGSFAADSNLTYDNSVGKLSAVYLSGDGSNITNISAGSISGSVGDADQANNSNYAGNVTVSSQPNITSLGTLTSLTVNGLVDITGNLQLDEIANLKIIGGVENQFIKTDGLGNLSFATIPNTLPGGNNYELQFKDGNTFSADSTLYYTNGNLYATRIVSDGYQLSNITGSNVTGTVANSTHSLTSNTVVNNAQPNITSVGTLTGLTVNGTSNLGNTDFVKIFGGNLGYVLRTDGGGNLEWVDHEPIANSVISSTTSPTGFDELVKLTSTTISFNNASRTFTITPTVSSFDVWVRGTRYNKTIAETVVIPDVSGTYYIYYDNTGTLVSSITVWDISTVATVSYLYWNSTTQSAELFFDERHGTSMDPVTHEYLHRTRGAQISFVPSVGFTIVATTTGTGSLNTDSEIGISSGTFYDEDIQIDVVNSATPTPNTWQQDLSNPGKIPVLYRLGNEWVLDNPTNTPLKFGTSLPTYNLSTLGVWSTPDINNNNYFVQFIVASNNLNYPVISIMGQDTYNNISDAENASFGGLDLTGLPISELRPLYQLIYQGSNGYTNSTKSRLRNYIDVRLVTASAGSVSVQAVDSVFRETPQTVFTNNPTANLAWDTYVDTVISNFSGNLNFVANISSSANIIAEIITANNEVITNMVVANIVSSSSSDQVTINSNSYITTFSNTGNVNFPSYVTATGYTGNGYLLSNINASNVSGTIANANFASYSNVANTANVALTVDGPNVTNTVANANFASYSNVANTANVALTVDGPNVTNTVANANYAAFSGNVTIAAQPNITSLGVLTGLTVNGVSNLTSVGNVKITGGSNGSFLTTDGSGNLSFIAPKKYVREWHVDPVNGVDDILAGSYDRPFLTLTYALTRVDSTGEVLYLHSGTYTESVNWSDLNVDIVGVSGTGSGLVNLTGNWDFQSASSSTRCWGLNFVNVTHSGGGSFYLKNGSISGTFNKTSGAYCQLTEVTAQGAGINITGSGQTVIESGFQQLLTINNSGATVSVSNSGSLALATLTAGTLLIADSTAFSGGASTPVITTSAGTALYVYNSRLIGTTSPGRVSVAGFWSINNTVYDSANSTLTGINLNTVTSFDSIRTNANLVVGSISHLGNVGNVKITGGSNGQFLQTDGTGNLTFQSLSSSGISNGTSSVSIPTTNGNVNITSAGNTVLTATDTGVNVSGYTNSTYFVGDVGNVSNIPAANIVGTVANSNYSAFTGNVINSSQPNITAVGNLLSLNVDGISNLNDVSNVKIQGGSNAQVLSTDGTGNLSWVAAATPFVQQPILEFTALSNATNQQFVNNNIASFSSNQYAAIYVNGILQKSEDYTISGNTLTVSRYLKTDDVISISPTSVTTTVSGLNDSYTNNTNIAISDIFTGFVNQKVDIGTVYTANTDSAGVVNSGYAILRNLATLYQSIAYDNVSTFIVVNNRGTVSYSIDNGVSWKDSIVIINISLNDAIFANGKFVIVAQNGKPYYATTPDSWTLGTITNTNALFSIASNGSRFVAVGNTGSIFYSDDAITWTAATSGTTNQLQTVKYLNNNFVAVGNNGIVLSSPDGLVWTTATLNGGSGFAYDIVFANSNYIITLANGTTNIVYSSSDLITFNVLTTITDVFSPFEYMVYYNNVLHLFASTTSNINYAYSTDLINFIIKPSPIYDLLSSIRKPKILNNNLYSTGTGAVVKSVPNKLIYVDGASKTAPVGTYKCLGSTNNYDSTVYLWSRLS